MREEGVVVGAGAAGLMTAVWLARKGAAPVVLDRRERFGAKILMSGGTRCNLTHARVDETDYETESKPILRSILRSFSVKETLRFFESLGIRVVLESTDKYFPSTHDARTVLDAFASELEKRGVRILAPRVVEDLVPRDGFWEVRGEGFVIEAKAVVLCSGGLSFPSSGSDGTGLRIARRLGHTVIPTSPALTPLFTNREEWKALSGLTVPVRLAYREKGKIEKRVEGSFLFTHRGFSGPAALDISRFWIRGDKTDRKIEAQFLPAQTFEGFKKSWLEAAYERPSKSVRNHLSVFLPERLALCLAHRAELPEDRTLGNLRKEERERLLQEIFGSDLGVVGDQGYEKAEVTAGGVDLREIRKDSMESRLHPGLFFAGEILDADGRIGGFNFQWAWATGKTAAEGVCRYLR